MTTTYQPTRTPYSELLDRAVGPRGRRDGVRTLRFPPGREPYAVVGAYYIGPYGFLMRVEGLFWGRPQSETDPRLVALTWRNAKSGLPGGRVIYDDALAHIAGAVA